jgi:cell division protein FtsB
MNRLLGFLLGVMIGCMFMISILGLQKQNDKLRKENQELQELVKDYKWQLDEMPNVMESVRDSWCNGE